MTIPAALWVKILTFLTVSSEPVSIDDMIMICVIQSAHEQHFNRLFFFGPIISVKILCSVSQRKKS